MYVDLAKSSNLTLPIALGNATTIDLDSGLFDDKKIYYHEVAVASSKNIKGFPNGVYGYGILITGRTTSAWQSFQIYIPHNSKNNSSQPIYVRTFGDTNASGSSIWRCINTTQVTANT